MMTNKIKHPGLISVDDLSRIINLTPAHIRSLCRDRKLPHYKMPGNKGSFFFDVVEVLRSLRVKSSEANVS